VLTGARTEDPLREIFRALPSSGVEWRLGRTRELLSRVGRPDRCFGAIHVGGTNGKGSAAAALEAILRRDGRRTGLYTSPHLVEHRDRYRIDGEPVARDRALPVARRIVGHARELGASRFEAETALAFLLFREAGVETAVVEVGLGGRLDATNVLEPEACLLTSVALDHIALLGDTPDSVAREKAGILKTGVPCAVGHLADAPLRVVERRAAEVGAPLRVLGRDAGVGDVRVSAEGTRFRYRSGACPAGLEVRTPLVGRHQAENLAVALLALEAHPAPPRPEARVEGLAAVRWRGRFERIVARGTGWILDVAHNPAALEATVETLEAVAVRRPWIWVLSILADKECEAMVRRVLEAGDHAILTVAPSSPVGRRWDPEAVRAAILGEATAATVGTGDGGSGRSGEMEVERGFDAALERARELAGGGTVVVSGSCRTVGDALPRLERGP